MMSYVYVLALIFFTITNGQVTSWTGGGGSGNSTITNPNNWSNGVPTATSIIYINETTCNGCTVTFDEDLTCAELHLGALTGSGPYVEIIGKTLTVTGSFTLGSASPTTYYNTYIDIQGGGTFEIGQGCVATIYYTGGYPIRSSIADEENWFINRGTVTVLGNGGVTAGSYSTMYIGYGSSYPLHVENWGSWDVSTGEIELEFYFISYFNVYGGNFKGGWTRTTGTPTPTIRWYGSDVVFQDGSGSDETTGVTGVTFEGAVYFYSYYTQYFTDYSTTPPNSVTFNTTGVTVWNALFYATNIVFLNDGWLTDCNITDYSLVNSSSTVSGVHAYFTGNNIFEDAVVAGIDTDFVVQVEDGATVTMNDYFALTGTVTLVNNGTWVFDSSSYLYFDVDAYWVNTGLMQVVNHANDYIQGTTFPGKAAYTDAGIMVNMGTIEFTNGGGLNFYYNTGTFLQCKHGILKFGYGVNGGNPGSVTLPTIVIDGYIGFYFEDDASVPTSGSTLFSFVPEDSGELPFGSFTALFDSISKGPGLIDASQLVCFSKDGTVSIYDLIDEKICPDGEYQTLLPFLTGDACSDLPDSIQSLQDLASCPAGANCGVDTGAPAGEPGPNSAHSLAVPLAFLVSLVCLLLKF
jgi:hypothetical protein